MGERSPRDWTDREAVKAALIVAIDTEEASVDAHTPLFGPDNFREERERSQARVDRWRRLLDRSYPKFDDVQTVGRAGGLARASRLSPTRRSEIASLAAQARWRKS